MPLTKAVSINYSYHFPILNGQHMTPEKTKNTTKELIQKRLASIAIFIMMAAFLAYEEPTIEIAWVTAILLLTIYLSVMTHESAPG